MAPSGESSRDPNRSRGAAQERVTAKQRAIRIPLDYYKRADALLWSRRLLSLAAAVVAVLWVAGSALGWGRADRSRSIGALTTHGPLARAHATWDNECEACHVPFSPIDGTSWVGRFFSHPRTSDAKCQACHNAADHHPVNSADDVGSCASCHNDHRGRDASLVDVADNHFTRCHANLNGVAKDVKVKATVSDFNKDHPDFAVLENKPVHDPGKLKFNHAVHMAKGFTLDPKAKPLKTVNDLAEADKALYRTKGVADSEGIQLRCDSCHVPDGDRRDPPSGTFAASERRGGAYMRPILYERDCRACHPLDYAKGESVRHGLQPAAVHEAITQALAARFVEGNKALKEWQPRLRPIPGPDDRPEVRAAQKAIGEAAATAERVLFGEKKCGECHQYETPKGEPIEALASYDAKVDPRVARPDVPQVWLTKAFFDHSAHKMVDCATCHAPAAASKTSADVLLPSVKVCQECHAPRESTATKVAGGAGTSCTECHRYHVGPSPSAAPPGATLGRDSGVEEGLRAFLRGTPRRLGE
jgi:hypothetical protein